MTLNYDTLLEQQLGQWGFEKTEQSSEEVWILRNRAGEIARSIALGDGGFPELIELASGNRKYRHDILHLHGRVDVPNSLVVSEQDYKSKYLDASEDQSGYRDGLDYLFASNPILFIGIGLNEEDPIRPLRQYLADKKVKRNRPIFALMPNTGDEPADRFEVLSRYLKYGIYTIRYGSSGPDSGELEQELHNLRTEQIRWWTFWRTFPKHRATNLVYLIRDTRVANSAPKRRKTYSVAARHSANIGHLRLIHKEIYDHLIKIKDVSAVVPENIADYDSAYNLSDLRDNLLDAIQKTPISDEIAWNPVVDPELFLNKLAKIRNSSVIRKGDQYKAVISGGQGSGKGSIVQMLQLFFPLLQRMRADGQGLEAYDSAIFINSSVSQEFSSVVDTICNWLDDLIPGYAAQLPEGEVLVDRRLSELNERLDKVKDKVFIVITNTERLFRGPTPINPIIDGLFRLLFATGKNVDLLVFTQDSECGEYFNQFNPKPGVHLLADSKYEEAVRLSGSSATAALEDNRTSLEGIFKDTGNQVYAMEVLAEAVADGIVETPDLVRISSMTSTLAQRVALNYLMGEVLRFRVISGSGSENLLLGSCLRFLALIGTPVEASVVFKCEQIYDKDGKTTLLQINDALRTLTRFGLVMPIHSNNRRTRFALHRLVRRTLIGEMTSISRVEGETSFFSTSLYGLQPEDTPTLDSATYYDLLKLLNRLANIEDDPTLEDSSESLRGAQGIILGFFSVSVLSSIQDLTPAGTLPANQPRLFDSHAGTLGQIYDGARRLSDVSQVRKPFYTHELAWLLNERGVMLLAQGNYYDSMPCLRQAMDMSKDLYTSYWIKINYSLACIGRGHFSRAIEGLEEVIKESKSDGKLLPKGTIDHNPHWMAQGWLGLVHHIQGRYGSAEKQYKKAIKNFEKLKRPRTVAIFGKHLSDLYRILEELEKSQTMLSHARAAAELSGSRDLMYAIQVAQANLELRSFEPDLVAVDQSLRQAIDYTTNIGMDSTSVDARLIRASVQIRLGRLDLAGELALEAASIATQNGMKLRKMSAQLTLARVKAKRGNKAAALKIARTIRDQCLHYKYQVLLNRAEAMLTNESEL